MSQSQRQNDMKANGLDSTLIFNCFLSEREFLQSTKVHGIDSIQCNDSVHHYVVINKVEVLSRENRFLFFIHLHWVRFDFSPILPKMHQLVEILNRIDSILLFFCLKITYVSHSLFIHLFSLSHC